MYILALSVHRMRLLLYIKTKSDNHVILEIKLLLKGNLPYRKLKISFRSKCRLNTLFRFKDPLEKKSALE